MLEPWKYKLDFKSIVLAADERVSRIFRKMGVNFELYGRPAPVVPDERKQFFSDNDVVINRALNKQMDVSRVYKDNPPDLIISVETLVTMDKKEYGKPVLIKDAKTYLEELNGREHRVTVGVVLKTTDAVIKFSDHCMVHMAPLSQEDIDDYVRTKEPFWSVGGYDLSGIGSSLINKIEGNPSVAFGLPLFTTCQNIGVMFD